MHVVDHITQQFRVAARMFSLLCWLLCVLIPVEASIADPLPDLRPNPRSEPVEDHVGIVNGTIVTAGSFPSLTALVSGRGVSIRLNRQHKINAKFFGHGVNSGFAGETIDCGIASNVCQDAVGKICLISIARTYTDLTPSQQLANCSSAGGVGAVFWLRDSILSRTDMFDGLPSIPAVFINELHSNRLLVAAMRSESLHVDVEPQVAQTILCGATHLGGRWVLTAAHCVVELTAEGLRKVQPWEITASVGAYDLTQDTNLAQAVEAIYLFDEIDSVSTVSSDIALLKLVQQPTHFRNSLSMADAESQVPVSASAVEIAAGLTVNEQSRYSADAMVLGWGSTGVREPDEEISVVDTTSTVPYAAWVSIVPVSQCIDLWSDYLGGFPNPVDVSPVNDRQMCAFEPVSQRDTCQGDSGGPLLIVVQGGLQLAGITSFGVGCGSTGAVPAVYTKVSEYTDWIELITGISMPGGPELSDTTELFETSTSPPPVRVNSMMAFNGGGSVSPFLLLLISVGLILTLVQRKSIQCDRKKT